MVKKLPSLQSCLDEMFLSGTNNIMKPHMVSDSITLNIKAYCVFYVVSVLRR